MDAIKRRELEREIAVLQGRKESRFRRVQRLFDLIGDLHDPVIRNRFHTLRGNLDETVSEFKDIVERLNRLNVELNDDFTVDYQALDAFEDLVCSIRYAARVPDPVPVVKSSEDSVPLAQLPKIEIPSFSGDPLSWPIFYDTFTSLIHSNSRLDDIAKMYYLMGSLKGRALEVCSGMPPTAANYPIVWENLVRKYQNPRLLADCHFRKMLDLRPLSSETSEGLTQLADSFSNSYLALKRLPLGDLSDFFISSLALSKLDPSSRKLFEMSDHSEIPTFDELSRFIRRQAHALAQLKSYGPAKRIQTSSNPHLPVSSRSPHTLVAGTHPSSSVSSDGRRPCPLCRGPHPLYLCNTFLKKSHDERWKLVEKNKLCFNCLSDVHILSSCKSQSSCNRCQKRHHTLLHREPASSKSDGTSSSSTHFSDTTPEPQNMVALQTPQKTTPSAVVLPTAVVKVHAPKGEFLVRFLVDSGSQAHILSLKCCRRLGISLRKGPGTLGGIGGVSEPVRGRATVVIISRVEENVQFEVDALVLQRVTSSMPSVRLSHSIRERFKSLALADPQFDHPGEVDGILGASVFAQILKPAPPESLVDGPTAVATKLGYIVMGSTPQPPSSPLPEPGAWTLCALEEPDLTPLISRFWELEEVGLPDGVSVDECEAQFIKTTTRTESGRYSVNLPFAEFPPRLGNSYLIAERRLRSLEKNLSRSPALLQKYHEGMKDYLVQGHITPAPASGTRIGYFIPHFAVYKESSSTPVRIVFDASCKSTNGRSLNDTLLTGPKLQTDIQEILLRFRLNPVAVVADIRQMFRNIRVNPDHRVFQKLLWRFRPEDPVQEFQLSCVPFGLSCAPFLALRTIKQLADDEKGNFPIAARIALGDMYVDDVVTSVPEEEAADLVPQLTGLFRAGGFTLAKWTTNSEVVAKHLSNEELQNATKDLDKGDILKTGTKVLGLNWNAITDTFFFACQLSGNIGTKRQILSTLARIWDPLGFLAPVTLRCKVLVKNLWLAKCGWDDPPPEAIKRAWARVVQELPLLTEASVPRYFGSTGDSNVFLVGFADSSSEGYGAVVYVVTLQGDQYKSTLLLAKSKVAPSQLCSIPRLELCAAVLLSRLFKLILHSIPHLSLSQVFALSDSEDVLYWLSKSPSSWKPFVANRVAQIGRVVSPDRWFHIPGKDNVADLISRGATPSQLLAHPAWWSGPSWLSLPPQSWPIRQVTIGSRPPLESKDFVAVVTQTVGSDILLELIQRSSSWSRLCRTVVFILRFGHRLPLKSAISASDLEVAELRLVRAVQMEHFAQDFALLAQKKPVTPALRHLSPFLSDGCIRVGGRLENANLSFSKKHPLLLPKRSHLVDLIIDHFHTLYLHAGPTLLLSLLRQKFWILSARGAVRKRIRSCHRCFRLNPKGVTPLMGSLPAPRVTETKPFVSSGVDYAGPFRVTIGRYRGVKTQKAYICLFICMSTKAIHLELASDLSTESFLSCLKRFVARRGPVSVLYSDCGTNFVGAKAQLDAHYALTRTQDFRDRVGDYLAAHKISWKFNPPAAPHFGGLWEAAVKSVKNNLYRVIGLQILSWEEFYTLLTQIESLLNSRPLGVLSADPSCPEALTPAHFLTLTPLRTLPLLSDPPPNVLPPKTRKSLLDQMLRGFWSRWRLEYLGSLHPRKRWTSSTNPLTVGTVVVVREDNSPPLHWPLGLIEEIHPGTDGVVRVATVRVRGTILKRPVVRLCPLPNQ